MRIEVVDRDLTGAPVPAAGQQRARRLTFSTRHPLAAWRDPLLRNGHFLTVSSGSTALIGLVYWTVAAHRYDTVVVGRSSAVIAAMMAIGGVAQLNLMSALMRFVPVAGGRTGRLVLGSYLTAGAVAAVLGIAFLVFAPAVSNQFRFVTDNPLMAFGFVLTTMAWTVFVLQDSVLIGLRLAILVAAENAAFSVVKVVAVIGLAVLLPRHGILLSWWVGLVVSLAATNIYLFRRALPRTRPAVASDPSVVSARTLFRFAGPDYLGALCWLGATTVMPFLVIADVGAKATAYFAVAWQFGLALFTLSTNMGSSLLVETAGDQSQLAQRGRRVMRHMALPLGAAVAVIEVGAPNILRLFGPAYGQHAVGLLRFLALAAIPNLVTATATTAARAQQRTVRAATIMAAVSLGVLCLSAALLPLMGLAGVGMAWLVTQSTVATVLLIHSAWWLQSRRPTDMNAKPQRSEESAATAAHDPVLLGVTVGLVVVAAGTLANGLATGELASVSVSVVCSFLALGALVVLSRLHRPPTPIETTPPIRELSLPPPSARSASRPPAGDGVGDWAEVLPIEEYDELRIAEILPLLQQLDIDQLKKVRVHESLGRCRASILSRIDILLEPDGDQVGPATNAPPVFPIEEYDELRVVEILPLLSELNHDQLRVVANRERIGAARSTVLTRIARLLRSPDGVPTDSVALAEVACNTPATGLSTSPATKRTTSSSEPTKEPASSKTAPANGTASPASSKKAPASGARTSARTARLSGEVPSAPAGHDGVGG